MDGDGGLEIQQKKKMVMQAPPTDLQYDASHTNNSISTLQQKAQKRKVYKMNLSLSCLVTSVREGEKSKK